ncbi:MAG TPA: ATP-binding protein [Gammaproteobacteria bacterium]|nr:ATP-binding protein [Gammaproteobacteria bacterium]HQZ87274.1 ATP-binding protein [Gammaproteobacteria bacterium]HRA42125.1 ATP-binding protein [Gammaproteobacteria bacterium]
MDATSTNIEPYEVARFLINGHFRFRSLPEAMALAEFLAKACPNPPVHSVGISEILVNAIEHGNLGITSEEKLQLQKENRWLSEIERRLQLTEHCNQYVNVEVTQSTSEIRLHVQDDGKGFNWKAFKKTHANNESTQGRGILMAERLAFKSLEYSEKGNAVICIISLH